MVWEKPVCRPLTVSDAGAVAYLEQRCFSLPWSRKQIERAFMQEAFWALGLLQEKVLFAYISVYHVVDEMEILNLAVLPERRRLGNGRLLLTRALQAGQKIGMHSVRLEVRSGNHAAISLYTSSGFRTVGVRRGYYTDTGEDALLLALLFTGEN
ncbi:MAG: ribosomal protein S18-alanine N-acetyltransferase [Desulfovibrionaceae bacterium]|nr:ribosomal protein S18-alanine N-acetyltransferase [Desulfovibrionaceae bacterium]